MVGEVKPKVSVCVVTYNQEPFIRHCLQSLVEQKTNFDFEVIVSDDGSKDGTRVIISEFASAYPSIVKPIFQEKNLGAFKNFVFVHESASGEFIAHMDGDDYALPGKLQIQADFLDKNPQCNICWHRMMLKNERTDALVPDLIDLDALPTRQFDRGDILKFVTIGLNSAKMYRRAVREFTLPPFPVMDFFANVEQVQDGFAAFVSDEPLGVYRTEIGIASGGGTKKIMKDCFIYFAQRYPCFKPQIGSAALLLFAAAAKNGRWREARLFGGVVLRTLSLDAIREFRANLRLYPMFRFPAAARSGT